MDPNLKPGNNVAKTLKNRTEPQRRKTTRDAIELMSSVNSLKESKQAKRDK